MSTCNIRYGSVRSNTSTYSFEESVLAGYGEDGGMLFPTTIPTITTDILKSWSQLTFQQLLLQLLQLYIPVEEIPTEDLKTIISDSFSLFKQQTHDHTEIINELSITPVIDSNNNTLHITELWHGPTLAFKDIPLQFCGTLLNYFLKRKQQHINVLVGTSGDTGSAAMQAVRNSPWVHINKTTLYYDTMLFVYVTAVFAFCFGFSLCLSTFSYICNRTLLFYIVVVID